MKRILFGIGIACIFALLIGVMGNLILENNFHKKKDTTQTSIVSEYLTLESKLAS